MNNFSSIFKIKDELKQNILYITDEIEETDYFILNNKDKESPEIDDLKLHQVHLGATEDEPIVIELNNELNYGLNSILNLLNKENITLDRINAYKNKYGGTITISLHSKDMYSLGRCLINNLINKK